MNLKSLDEKYMRMALRLAAKARGRTSPNPMVGALVVRDGVVISRGYHRRAGEPHAEAIALARAGEAARGATLYVTLEPCTHTGKRTPPCAPQVVRSGVARAVVAMTDPNPKVAGGGVKALQAAGIEVIAGVLEDEAKKLNEAYAKHILHGMPFVTLKIAQTLDGRIATASGESKWITGEEARRESHLLRDGNDAILVGINTVLKDDPALTTRVPKGRDPLRVIVDSRLRIPRKAKVLTQRSSAPTLIAALARAPKAKRLGLQKTGIEVLIAKEKEGRVDLRDLLKQLGRRGTTSVLIEGGSEINASALKAGVVDKVVIFVAPMLLSGRDSMSCIGGASPARLDKAVKLRDMTLRQVGKDLMIEAYVAR